MHRHLSYILSTAAIISITNCAFYNAYQEGDFEEFYTTPLTTTRYPNHTAGYAM